MVACGLLLLAACRREPTSDAPSWQGAVVFAPHLPATPYPYSALNFPQSWLDDPALALFSGFGGDIEVTDAGATLGRVLFHDTRLSVDNSVSCGSCHRQSRAFADDVAGSTGVSGIPLARNTPGLFNLQYQRRLFWDMRVVGLENQVLQPIGHPDEMGMDLGALVDKLADTPYYPQLFEDAFGDAEVNLDRIMDALVQFLSCIRTYQSRYDAGLANDFADFTESELLGKDVFFNGSTRCNQCHSGLNFFSTQPTINGLENDYAAAGDGGIGDLTGNAADDGRFKTVSLRNVGLTAPYMHDGRFATLREVVDFYSDNIEPHPHLDERLSEAGMGPSGQAPYLLDLNEAEREGLVAFLHTLTDTAIVADPIFGSPF